VKKIGKGNKGKSARKYNNMHNGLGPRRKELLPGSQTRKKMKKKGLEEENGGWCVVREGVREQGEIEHLSTANHRCPCCRKGGGQRKRRSAKRGKLHPN